MSVVTTAAPVELGSVWRTLSDRMTEARVESPLTRITILAPPPASGLDVARRLARESAHHGGHGVANVLARTVGQPATETLLADGTAGGDA